MIGVIAELVAAPLLVAASAVASRRWGAHVGGLVGAFPAVVGPVLLILAEQRGNEFAAKAANGTLLGLVALAGFACAYARMVRRSAWPAALAAGWVCAAAVSTLLALLGGELAFPGGLAAATISLAAAHRALPTQAIKPRGASPVPSCRDMPLRMAVTAALVIALTTAAKLVGPLVGGMLAALPVLASVIAVFTHRNGGAHAVISLLRGMVAGMAGFVGFCAVLAALIVPLGAFAAFMCATLAAVLLQATMLSSPARAGSSASA